MATPHQIYCHWAARRSPVAREWAIKAFLSISDPIRAAETAAYMERAGADGMRRFLLECMGYRTNPGMWRAQERAWWRRNRSKPDPLAEKMAA